MKELFYFLKLNHYKALENGSGNSTCLDRSDLDNDTNYSLVMFCCSNSIHDGRFHKSNEEKAYADIIRED